MIMETPIAELLRWRFEQAKNQAPPAPRATRLLELTRPWWETLPAQFQSLARRVANIQVAYGHAMTEPLSGGIGGYPVAALVVRTREEWDTSVRVLYLSVRDRRLRLRFQIEALPSPAEQSFEVTFVADGPTARPELAATASLSLDSEYRLDADLTEELAKDWERLKATDRMPFRLILRPVGDGN